MLVSILLVFLIVLGGFALTYPIADDEPLMWRIAAGNVIGSALFGTLSFVGATVAGFTTAAMIGCFAVFFALLLVFRNAENLNLLRQDLSRAAASTAGTDVRKIARLAYYAFFLLLFVFFFRRALIETPQGIFTGGSQNTGDLPFHLGAIFSFTEGNNFPPENPSFAGSRFSYPFIADFLTAVFMRLGAGIADAMFVQNVSWAFSMLVIFERFVVRFTGDRLAGKIGPMLLFFSGGLGFVIFFTDFWAQGKSFIDFLWQIPADYTIGENFRWGNSMVVLFITQRSILLGMPLTLLIIGSLWQAFASENPPAAAAELRPRRALVPLFVAGLLGGLLPLVHLHSLAVLFVVGVFLFALQPRKWKTWLAFAAGVAVVAVPELLWSLSGSASKTSKFIGWNFGWNKAETESFVWFWFMNTGIFVPAAALGIYLLAERRAAHEYENSATAERLALQPVDRARPLLFYLPFAFLFLASNVAKFAPWEWDNIKLLIYWFAASIPFAAYALSRLWHRGILLKATAVVSFAVLTLSGSIDVWRTASGQINDKIFDRDAVRLAEGLKKTTTPNSLFLNAPTYNSAVVLTGRRSLMRYIGHLSSHGIDYTERESDLKQIYLGGPDAAGLLEKYKIDYVLISPEERNMLSVNEAYFMKFPVAGAAGQYRVYKIR